MILCLTYVMSGCILAKLYPGKQKTNTNITFNIYSLKLFKTFNFMKNSIGIKISRTATNLYSNPRLCSISI